MEDSEKFLKIKEEIAEIIKQSPIKTDYFHSLSVFKGVLNLKPNADMALKIAALGHDIDRSIPSRQPKREDFEIYEDYKKVHSIISAEIILEIVKKYGLPKKINEKIKYLVENHEIGGDEDANILNDSDSVAFFERYLLDLYIQSPHHSGNFRNKVKFSYERASIKARDLIKKIKFENPYQNGIIQSVINEIEKEEIKF